MRRTGQVAASACEVLADVDADERRGVEGGRQRRPGGEAATITGITGHLQRNTQYAERMSAEKRREQLLRVMKTVFAGAKTQSEFTAQKVARAGDVSVVLLYRSVGKEFKELRAQLDGPQPDDTTLVNKLKRRVKENLPSVKAC